MAKELEEFDKFVRLNVTGKIVEVLGHNSTEIVINYKGTNLILKHYEVSTIAPEEAVAAAEHISN